MFDFLPPASDEACAAHLLAADVLPAKDLDKALKDRARWRSDERRRCRSGRLPRPGWWPEHS